MKSKTFFVKNINCLYCKMFTIFKTWTFNVQIKFKMLAISYYQVNNLNNTLQFLIILPTSAAAWIDSFSIRLTSGPIASGPWLCKWLISRDQDVCFTISNGALINHSNQVNLSCCICTLFQLLFPEIFDTWIHQDLLTD